MRIGIDARMFRSSTAGIGRYSQNLIKKLLEIDHKNQYVLFMTPADYEEFKNQKSKIKMTNQNVKIKVTNIPHYSIAEQTKLANIIAKEKCDLVHFLNFNYPVKYRGKFMVTIHDLTLLFYPEAANKTNLTKKWAFKYVFAKACRNSSRIIAVSENTKNDIVKTFHIAPEKIKVIHEAADDKLHKDIKTEDIRTLKQKYNIKGPVILYVGQFRKHKNIEGLLKAYEIIKKKLSVRLVLVGKVTEEIKNYIDSKPEIRDTLMPGFVSDAELAAWYKLASVFVFPSLYEGFGLPGLEAMIAGVPVVSSKGASLPEIYQDAALYFDPLKPKEIADKIKTVISDKVISDQLIEKGKIQAKKYSWSKTAEETLKIYQKLREE